MHPVIRGDPSPLSCGLSSEFDRFMLRQPFNQKLLAFLRDKLQLPYTDVGEGWLIFGLPEAEMGCQPANAKDGSPSGTHNISFHCYDIQKTITELKKCRVKFTDGISDHGYGLVTHFRMPGNVVAQLYQPRYVKRRKRSQK